MTASNPAPPQPLDALRFPLRGSHLIEASAGTGKTWSIAALCVRLVLGHGGPNAFARPLVPADVLVMTFTRAATRELSDRIRARLVQAARCFRGEPTDEAPDTFLLSLLADYPAGPERQHAAWRLATAADAMDEAAVFTIDAWCQRVLREHAFDSGSLFDEALVASEQALRLQAAQDFWRQATYPLAEADWRQVHAVWPGIDRFVADMASLAERDIPSAQRWHGMPLANVLATTTTERQQGLQTLRDSWVPRVAALQTWFDAQTTTHKAEWDGRRLSKTHGQNWLNALTRWVQVTDPAQTEVPDVPDLKTGWERFTPEGLADARKPGSPGWQVPPEIHALAALQAELARLPTVAAALRGHAAQAVGERVALLKAQAGSFGFQDMLRRLDAALGSERGPALRERILARYPVALVDEFQDTSPLQYRIFDRIYRTADNLPDSDTGSALLLIGDPKQSIYGFRGADIHSYLRARVATAGRHHVLGTNRRSTHAMVQAVNGWFAWAERRDSVDGGLGGGAFMFRQSGQGRADDPMPFLPVDAHGRAETLVTSAGPVPALTLVHSLDEARSQEDHRTAFAQRCAEQIVAWLNDPAAGFDTPGQPRQPLRPADIAVLVRTGTEADAVRHALALRQVPSVYLSDKDSVFRSPEARDLVHWLTAVSQPQNVRAARAGLATGLLGLSLSTLAELATRDEALDAQLDTLRQLQRVWLTRGVLAMLRRTLHVYGLPARWLSEPLGERRLTNLLHLAELLQTASDTQGVGSEGQHALIRWLATQTTDEATPADDQLVRLESDADLVKVVTVHKSKGLEYPVVCLPFATHHREVVAKGLTHVTLPGDGPQAEREVLLKFGSEEVNTVERERLKEDTRLLYVALTRARHAVWLGFAAVRTGNSDACRTHLSAAGCLTAGPAPREAADWLGPLQALAHALASATPGPQSTVALVEAAPVDAHFPVTPLRPHTAPPPLGDAAPTPQPFETDWGVGSFSALVRDLRDLPNLASATPSPTTLPALAPFAQPRPADDEPADAPQAAPIATLTAAPWHRFVRGAVAGNFLHEQLEWLAAEGFALATQPALAERLRRRCERSPYALQADDVVAWLTALVQTPLPHLNASLADITTCLPEMAFWLPVDHLSAYTIDTLCQQHLLPGVPRPPLPKRQLHGMLMGFADLVFEHGGRYWVLDHKSNHLGPDGTAYTAEALAHVMAHHRYDVQAALYLLALHRLLTVRLGDYYDPEQHLGGAVYLFLRGIDGPTQGVHWVPPNLPLLTALDAALPAGAGV